MSFCVCVCACKPWFPLVPLCSAAVHTAISNNSHLNKHCSAVHRVQLWAPSLPGVQAWWLGSSLEYKEARALEGMQDAPDSAWEKRGHTILSRNNPGSGPFFAPYLRGDLYANRVKGSAMWLRVNIHQQAVIGRCSSEQLVLSSQVIKEEGQTQGINLWPFSDSHPSFLHLGGTCCSFWNQYLPCEWKIQLEMCLWYLTLVIHGMLVSSANWIGSTNIPSWLASHVWNSAVTPCVGSLESRNLCNHQWTVMRAIGGRGDDSPVCIWAKRQVRVGNLQICSSPGPLVRIWRWGAEQLAKEITWWKEEWRFCLCLCGAFWSSFSLQAASRIWNCNCHHRIQPGLLLGE